MQSTLRPIELHQLQPKLKHAEGPLFQGFPLFYTITFGILLPLAALLLELAEGWSRQIYLNPIPTNWHVAAVLVVPMANFFALWTPKLRSKRWFFLASNLNGAAMVIAGIYALLFIPMIPIGLIGLLYVGLGFLPLSPLLSFLAAVLIRRQLSKRLEEKDIRSAWLYQLGALCAVSAVVLPAIPIAMTYYAGKAALDPHPVKRAWGLSWLRSSADPKVLAEMANDSWRHGSRSSFLKLSPNEAKTLLFLTSGKTVDSFTPPQISGFRFDQDQGNQVVGMFIPEVSLALSQMDASVDADAGVAYTEWTFSVRNVATIQNEARMEVELPPDGVVSRLTLWINGEPQEAAFGSRSQTTAAYQRVVQQRRDPVLVTTTGPNRVLIQCFPIPPSGGVMQARIGVTSPLRVDPKGHGQLTFPKIVKRNFVLDEKHATGCWVEARAPLWAASLTKWSAPEPGSFALKGDFTTAQLGECVVRFNSQVRPSFFRQNAEQGGKIITQQMESIPLWRPDKLVIVLETSAGMEPARDELVKALPLLASDCETTLLLTTDEGARAIFDAPKRLSEADLKHALATLESLKFVGGKPSRAALEQAWDLASNTPRGAVLWLHGVDPVTAEFFGLENRLSRHPTRPRLLGLQVVPGENLLSERLRRYPNFEHLPWASGAVRTRFQTWATRLEEQKLVRTLSDTVPAEAVETSSHLQRLWAHDEVHRQIALGKSNEATQLAVATKIVTPVSGAVVLETAQQYQQAGLKPGDSKNVPSVPEPGETLLMLTTLLFLLAKRRRASGVAVCV